MRSQWLIKNQAKLSNLRHKLEELELMGSYSEIPLREIVELLSGAEHEIRRVDAEATQLTLLLKQVQEKKEGKKGS